MTIAIPSIVADRWREAVQKPSIARWHSLADMLASMATLARIHAPGSVYAYVLNRMMMDALKHAIRLQPRG